LKLYEIEQSLLELLQAIESGDIPSEAIADTLESVEGDYNTKIDNIACYIKALRSEAEAIKREADTLTERAKAKQNHADRLKQYIFDSMAKLNKDKIETARNALQIRNTPPAVKISDETEFIAWAQENADDLLDYKPPTIKKTAVKNYINAGNTIAGVTLESGKTLAIK